MSDEYKNTAVIVLPVIWPSAFPQPKVKDLHVTIAFLGDIDEEGIVKSDVIEAIQSVIMNNTYIFADVYEMDYFGPDSDIPVVLVRNPAIQEIYKDVTTELAVRNVFWSQNYSFNPHITIDHETMLTGPIPPRVMLKPMELWWKQEKVDLGE